jgi:hypothetical protein
VQLEPESLRFLRELLRATAVAVVDEMLAICLFSSAGLCCRGLLRLISGLMILVPERVLLVIVSGALGGISIVKASVTGCS